jgi:hypothetical protein
MDPFALIMLEGGYLGVASSKVKLFFNVIDDAVPTGSYFLSIIYVVYVQIELCITFSWCIVQVSKQGG